MCGRYVISSSHEIIEEVFGAQVPNDMGARFNIAPADTIPVVVSEKSERRLRRMRWGLTPAWARQKTGPRGGIQVPSWINARCETIAEKPSFRDAFHHRRCLLPADAFYEWKSDATGKTPYAICLVDGSPFAMAGVWETWTSPHQVTREGAAVVTTQACAEMRSIHERMPVLIHPDHHAMWLNPKTSNQVLRSLMLPVPEGVLKVYAVGDRVNSSREEGADLLQPRGLGRLA